MKTKQLIQLLVILGVLSALVAVKQFQKPKELATQEYVPLDLSLDIAQVASVEITRPSAGEGVSVVLEKAGTDWKLKNLSGARADSAKVEEFLKEIRGIQGEMRASDPALFKDFGIGADEALKISLKDASQKALLDLRLGLKKAGGRSSFIRKEGSNAVYLTPADLYGKMGIYGEPKDEKVDPQSWASTVLSEIQPDLVEGIEVKHFDGGKESVTAAVERRPGAQDPSKKEWKFLRTSLPFEPDVTKVRNFAESFKTWKAQKVLAPNANQDYGFQAPKWQLAFRLEGGKSVTVKAGSTDKDTNAVFMEVSGEPVIFLLSTYYAENMDADDTRFFSDNPLGVDKAKLLGLKVTTDKGVWEVKPKDQNWDGLTRYVDDLKNFSVARILKTADEQKKAKSPSKFSIEILKEGAAAPLIVDWGEAVKDSPKEYAVTFRGFPESYAAAEVYWMNLLDQAGRLQEPPPAKTESVPPAPPASEPKPA